MPAFIHLIFIFRSTDFSKLITMGLDLLGTIFSLAATVCLIRAHICAWPLSILAASLNTALYNHESLTVCVLLEWMILGMSFYGWFYWRRTNSYMDLISSLGLNRTGVILLTLCLLCPFVYQLLDSFIGWTIEIRDMLVLGVSLVAQWLTCRKFLECWFLWLISDVIYISLMWDANLPFHVLLYTIYLIMAIVGFFSWLRIHKRQIVIGV